MFRRVGAAIVTLVVLVLLLALGVLPSSDFPPLVRVGHALGPHGYFILFNAIWIVVPIAVVAIARGSLRIGLRELGIAANPVKPLLFGLVATAPASIGFALTSHTDPSITWSGFFLFCVYNPFAEELLFRAFSFGQLYYAARWNFWAAVIIPAALFASGHLYQARNAGEMIGILLITGLGAIIFSYFFARFRRNIWAPFALHMLLNTWWTVFTTNQNALGGWADNLFRFGSIALAFAIVYAARRWNVFRLLAPKQGAFRSEALAA